MARLTLRLAFDAIGLAPGKATLKPTLAEPNLVGSGTLGIGPSMLVGLIASLDLAGLVETVDIATPPGGRLLYPLGLSGGLALWRDAWLGDTAEATAFRARLRALAARDDIVLLLDLSDGALEPDGIAQLGALLARIGFPRHRVLLLLNDPSIGLRAGPDRQAGMMVFGANFHEAAALQLLGPDAASILERTRNAALPEEPLFLWLNQQRSWHAIVLAALLRTTSLGEGALLPRRDEQATGLEATPEFAEAMQAARRLTAASLTDDLIGAGADGGVIADPATAPYGDSFASIIAEPAYGATMSGALLTRPVFTAIAHRHPFILAGAPGALAELRGLGYAGFAPIFSEAHDLIEAPVLRLDATIAAIAGAREVLRERPAYVMDALRDIAGYNQDNFFSLARMRFGRVLSDLELAFERLQHSGVRDVLPLPAADIPTGMLLLSQSQLVKLSGFHGLETTGQWCGSVGEITFHLPEGIWHVELRFHAGTARQAPIPMLDGVRLRGRWASGGDDTFRFTFTSSGLPATLRLHASKLLVPMDVDPGYTDERMLSFWLVDEWGLWRPEEMPEDFAAPIAAPATREPEKDPDEGADDAADEAADEEAIGERAMVLVLGNHQARVFAFVLSQIPAISARFAVRHVGLSRSAAPAELPDETELAKCRLVLCQVSGEAALPEPIARGLPAGTRVIRFPLLDLHLLWPLYSLDPRNVASAEHPQGRYPFGDRAVVELLREGLAGGALWDAYMPRSLRLLPDLERLSALESRRLAARDEQADIRASELVMMNHARVRLFWSINHPTGWLLGRVLAELLEAARDTLGLRAGISAAAMQAFDGFEPFGQMHQPIHPEIGRRLKLRWWSEDLAYRQADGTMLGFEAAMRRYIDFA